MTLHIGVVGCGKIAEKHLNAYRNLDVEVTVTDVVEKGRTVAANYGARWHSDPEEIIARDHVDAIDVCTPTPSHAPICLHALDSGKHVFCEKPLARSLADAVQIREKAAEVGTTLMVGYLYRFHPAFQFCRDVVRERIIGQPYLATFRLGGRGSHKAWKHRLETGGGAANEMLVHMLDLALWYFGDPVEIRNVHTETVLPSREIEGEGVAVDAEDLVVLRLQMEGGIRVLCQSDLITPGYMNHVEVAGTNGSLFTSILDYLPTSIYCKEARGLYELGHNFFEFPKVDLFELELRHFVETVSGADNDRLNSVDDSIRLMKLIEMVVPGHSESATTAGGGREPRARRVDSLARDGVQ